jgi:hypothetical protein
MLRRLLRLVVVLSGLAALAAGAPLIAFWPDFELAPLAPFVFGLGLAVMIAAMQLLRGLSDMERPPQVWRSPEDD